ncbi:D-amino acid dehydrogenase [Marinomonas sp. 15G1-11]|uniref:D-amino acid dehydrogenase n=1 Tax=Marinomonas phaeophyticola TaxID=3004091 RepID=A0ABT4JUK4_9GAMM|nr:D-amino acid dehydrogenase [Marinomonas sp. 15G1-11]MCZ2722080.1 D-amino acid dehydrogenase [Marinomonas sp. 15G1-11]
MRICILGAGVIGLSSAYYLAKLGFDVTVIDRQKGPALETSFANAGQISPGYSSPWAAPGVPLKAVKWLLQEHSPLKIGLKPELDKFLWVSKMLRQCTSAAYDVNKSRMVMLAEYSRDQFKLLRQELNLTYDDAQKGTLQLFRTQSQIDSIQKDMQVLKKLGVPHQLLSAKECSEVEPGLSAVQDKLQGGLRLLGDETGDCFVFCQKLKVACDSLGVKFMFNTDIERINVKSNAVSGVMTSQGELAFSKVLVCLGSYSAKLMNDLKLSIPVYPVKGYSLTVPVNNEQFAPISTVMDETYKVAVTRLGGNIRAAGTAELNGFDLSLPESRTKTIQHVVHDLFGQGCNLDEAQYWCGLRPMTPDGTPIIGGTSIKGVFLNTGHGTLGWTMCCGSGRVIADIISETASEIDVSSLSIHRYH